MKHRYGGVNMSALAAIKWFQGLVCSRLAAMLVEIPCILRETNKSTTKVTRAFSTALITSSVAEKGTPSRSRWVDGHDEV